MATSPAIGVFAMKKYGGQAFAQSIAERTRESVVPLTRLDPTVLNQCEKILVESEMHLQDELRLIRAIAGQNPEIVIVVLGSVESAEDIAKLAEAGACGYVPADADFEEMLAIVRSAAKGEFICPPRINFELFLQLAALAQNRQSCSLRDAGLTSRERQVLHLLDRFLSRREIANRLCVSECTVKSHVYRVRKKLANNVPAGQNQSPHRLKASSQPSQTSCL